MTVEIRRATEKDLDAVLSLLAESGLPQDDLADHLETTLVATDNSQIVGSAALELYPDGALLRSVAVAPRLRGSGLGHRLTDAATELARQLRVPALFLSRRPPKTFSGGLDLLASDAAASRTPSSNRSSSRRRVPRRRP